MSHALFLRHRARPGKREELIEAWRRHMPAAIVANDGHEAYVYTSATEDPDVLCVYQQYRDAHAAAEFLQHPEYLLYVKESEHLLAGPPEVIAGTPVWSKRVGDAGGRGSSSPLSPP